MCVIIVRTLNDRLKGNSISKRSRVSKMVIVEKSQMAQIINPYKEAIVDPLCNGKIWQLVLAGLLGLVQCVYLKLR